MQYREDFAEDYRELRERVKEIKSIKGTPSTNDLMRVFDRTFRTLLSVRKNITETIRERVPQYGDYVGGDFYSDFLVIHQPNGSGNALCGECFCEISNSLENCAFCGVKLVAPIEAIEPGGGELDLDIIENPPNWDINYEADDEFFKEKKEEETKEQLELIPKLKPVTKKSLIPPLKRKQISYHYLRHKNSKLYTTIRSWARKDQFSKHFPYDGAQLEKLDWYDLKTIIRIFPNQPDGGVRRLNKRQMISYILSHQPQQPVEVPKPKRVHVEIPKKGQTGNG